MQSFDDFFGRATDGHPPFDWQRRMALGDDLPEVVKVPTGAGKTEGAVLAWLWRRQQAETREATPRRLVYCLPLRVLVEQTEQRCRTMLSRLGLADEVDIHVLMGGTVSRDWTERPEDDAILVGTLDQLLSRALLRGYGISRFQWPVHFALLNNDALWVLDEVQLFGEALATSSQLEGLRRALPAGAGSTGTVAMSATVEPEWIATVDRPQPTRILGLSDADRSGPLSPRLSARKTLRRADAIDAGLLLENHRPGTLTLAITNTVAAARELHRAVARAARGPEGPGAAEIVLLHSRFRPADRVEAVTRLTGPIAADGPGRIVISTQVVEAGVDVSAATLVTQAAPWASLVQRFGRCNRRGEIDGACVIWSPVVKSAPYDETEVERAARVLDSLEGLSVGPEALERVDAPLDPPPRRHVLRRRDLLGLFDTAPDLSGLDVDVGRFVRDVEELTVSLAWRRLPDGAPAGDEPDLRREELCPIGIGEARAVVKDAHAGRRPPLWRHDPVDGVWRPMQGDALRPGDRLLVDLAFGCYDPSLGFDPALKAAVDPEVAATAADTPESIDSDARSVEGVWLSIAEHTDGVCHELEELLPVFPALVAAEVTALRVAARHHDWGKVHEVFQAAMHAQPPEGAPAHADSALAKRVGRAPHYERPGFRHELASLLAYLAQPNPDPLAAYLIAAHHGRVRLGGRTVPVEKPPRDPGRAYMLGCWQNDVLPSVDLGSGNTAPETTLDLGPMELGSDGAPTYTDMALTSLAELGPFRLALLETILRTADARRSRREAAGA